MPTAIPPKDTAFVYQKSETKTAKIRMREKEIRRRSKPDADHFAQRFQSGCSRARSPEYACLCEPFLCPYLIFSYLFILRHHRRFNSFVLKVAMPRPPLATSKALCSENVRRTGSAHQRVNIRIEKRITLFTVIIPHRPRHLTVFPV